jgi:hypothetical protein
MYTRKKLKIKNKTRVFKKSELNSGDGMLTTVWGPSMWHSLHTMSFNYPVNPTPEDKKNYRFHILNLQNVLPCKYCRMNLKKNFKKLPLKITDMKNRDTFSRYIYNLHEVVNAMLGKKSGLSYCDVRERYEHFRARCTTDTIKIKPSIEKGCTEPLYSGHKAKEVINIVPNDTKCPTLSIHSKCFKEHVN